VRELFRRFCITVGAIVVFTFIAFVLDTALIEGLRYWFSH
jgi:preprotein translocase subunit SecE